MRTEAEVRGTMVGEPMEGSNYSHCHEENAGVSLPPSRNPQKVLGKALT